jgi:SAM-dependent methyltransferase
MDWFADEDFWEQLYPAMFPPERFAVADQQVDQILALTRFTGRTVLDLCCGPGRHSVSFARRGMQVTGVDRTKFLLDRARERASQAAVEVEWVEEDMRRFRREGAFDLACSLFTSFGYFEDDDEDLAVLRNVWESLAPGGVFVVDVAGKEKVARHWLNSMCHHLEDGTLVLQRPEVCKDWTRIRNEWTLIKDGRTKSFRFEHTIYSGRELRDRMREAGFAKVELYGDLEGRPYGLDATRLVAVGAAG